ncbi:VOC family protein [Nocardia sp. NPDC005366]|uniref:VOC family protein n=1 Tax=Nocardia sp. NPDC005366 TaxID=3156878 RepID=UPI0033ABC13E
MAAEYVGQCAYNWNMALSWKLVVDSANAPDLADFWAAALGYEVEDPSALIERLLAAGHIGEDAVVEHNGHRIFRGLAGIRHPDDPFDDISGVGHGRRLLFQDVPEPKSGKNRLHVDIHSEPGGLDALVTRLEVLGATRVHEVDQGPAGHWWVMRDPEGNEFCAA